MVATKAILLAAGFMLATNAALAGPLTLVPKSVPDRYTADNAFNAVILSPQTFCRTIGLRYTVAGLGCGGMIVHDHKAGPSPTAFLGKNGNNFVGIPDNWWQAVKK